MESKIEKWRHKVADFYANIKRDEFIELLTQAGFEVKDGTGRIINDNGNDVSGLCDENGKVEGCKGNK